MTSNSIATLFRITIVSTALAGCTAPKPGPELAQAQYATCEPCHGANAEGSDLVGAPALAGQATWYLSAQLTKFKTGVRGAHPRDVEGLKMRPMSMSLKTEDIEAMAQYLSGLPVPKPKRTQKGDYGIGNALYRTCAACHGKEGLGNEGLKAPALVGLNDWYMISQLGKFKSGVRGANPKDVTGAMMVPMAMTLSDDKAIHDVVAHIMTLNE